MPRGNWDYGVNPSGIITAPQIGLAELAARLGSPAAYDRLGEVFFVESWDYGLAGWDTAVSGTGAEVVLDAGRGLHGAYCGKLVAGSDADRSASLSRSVVFPFLVRTGLEFAWSLTANLQDGYAYLDMYTGVYRIRWGIRYQASSGQNYVWAGAGAWQAVGTAQVNPDDQNLFIPAKFVVDPNTLAYVRFRAGPVDFTVSSYSGVASLSASLPQLRVTGQLVGALGTNAVVLFDRLILTTNEP